MTATVLLELSRKSQQNLVAEIVSPVTSNSLQVAIAGQLPGPEEALEQLAGSADPVERIAAATEFLLRHVLSRQGVARAVIAATINRPGQPQAHPGLRFGPIDSALAPLDGTLGATQPAVLAQLKRDLAVVVSAEALFTLTDDCGLDAEEAIASLMHTATTLTHAALGCQRIRPAWFIE